MADLIAINLLNPNPTNKTLPSGAPSMVYADFQVTVNGVAGSPDVRAVILYKVAGGTQKIEGTRVLPADGGPTPPLYRYNFPALPGGTRVHLAVIAETTGTGENHQSTILPAFMPPMSP